MAIVDTAAMPHLQERAIAHVTSLATGEPVDPSLRVTLHFHPDRLVAGAPMLEIIARDGVYRSQFETGTSNGGLTAHPGGDRWRWESRIFAGAYDDGPPAARPKYGSLNFRRRLAGGSPRFGSAYLRLDVDTLARTTFCYPDSVFEPRHFGVASRLSTLIALAEADDKDPLDDYIEAQVHGVVDLTRDVEALVLRPLLPRHAGTERGQAAGLPGRMARRLHLDHYRATPAPRVRVVLPRPSVAALGIPGPSPVDGCGGRIWRSAE